MKRVCILEDDPATMQLYHYCLRSDLFVIEGFKSAEAVLGVLCEKEYDLFLLDMDLPKMSGLELLAILRGLPKYAHTPVVMVTAQDYLHSKEDFYKAGVTALFAKPFSPSLLNSRLLELLGLSV